MTEHVSGLINQEKQMSCKNKLIKNTLIKNEP